MCIAGPTALRCWSH